MLLLESTQAEVGLTLLATILAFQVLAPHLFLKAVDEVFVGR